MEKVKAMTKKQVSAQKFNSMMLARLYEFDFINSLKDEGPKRKEKLHRIGRPKRARSRTKKVRLQ